MLRFLYLFFFIALISLNAYASPCNPGEALSRARWASFGKVKEVVSIAPFENQSKDGGEEWLKIGLAELLGDYLSASKKTGIITGLTMRYPPAEAKPNFIISGAYQKSPNSLRVFIKVYSPSGKEGIVYQNSFGIAPPDTGRLFIEMKNAALEIAKNAKISLDKNKFEYETASTSSYRAYESYIKGLDALWKFDDNHLDVARLWFQESKRQDIYFQKPYFAMADMYGYLAMIAKAGGKPYTQYLEKLEATETERMRFAVRPSPVPSERPQVIRKDLKLEVANRFLNGNSFYMAGIETMKLGDFKKAGKDLEKAIKYVPEDTVALRSLYNVYSQLGDNEKAASVLNKISVEGICQ